MQFSHVEAQCYQWFLDEFSAQYADSLNILQVDNGAFHKAKDLCIPDNIILLFQPAYCPELNPTHATMAASEERFALRVIQRFNSTANKSR